MTSLSVSTLGAPGADLASVLDQVRQQEVSGLELRLSRGEIVHPAMTAHERIEVAARLADAGVRVTAIASYIQVASDAKDEMVVGALAAAMHLAAELRCPTVRVFPGAPTHPATYDQKPVLREAAEEVAARAARRLDAVALLAEDLGVHPALETHDSHPQGADVAAILQQVNGPVGAIWDLMHPWRTGETLQQSWDSLSPWLPRGGVQIKDAALPGDPTPLLIGQGTLPVHEFAELLRRQDYDGVICLEWEKKWHPAAAPLPEALASTVRWFRQHWDAPVGPGPTPVPA